MKAKVFLSAIFLRFNSRIETGGISNIYVLLEVAKYF